MPGLIVWDWWEPEIILVSAMQITIGVSIAGPVGNSDLKCK